MTASDAFVPAGVSLPLFLIRLNLNNSAG